jgi:hypothetical protein
MQILGPRSLNRSLNRNLLGKGLFDSASLDLRFAVNKTLDPRVTFTRASTGTYVGGDGTLRSATTNEARFDHNPTTGESLGLLVEEARTNLVLRSEEFNNASWTKTRSSVTANAIVAPDSATTADKLVEDTTASATHQVHQSTTKAASALPYAGTIYVKAAERSQVFVGLSDFGGNESYAIFNLSTKTVGTPTNAGTFTGGSAVITELSNGWFRCSISATSSTSTTLALLVRIANSSGSVIYTGDGTSGIYVWGAQVEAASFPTSYIPTTTATVTRAADLASMTGTNFSSWYNATSSSVFVEWKNLAPSMPSGSFQWIAEFSDNTDQNRQFLFQVQAAAALVSQNSAVSGVVAGRLDAGGSYVNTGTKAASAFAASDRALVANGGSIVSSAAGALPPGINRATIGNQAGGNASLNGTIKRLTYWPVRLPNITLQAITTS